MYEFSAKITLIIHFIFIIFVVLGSLTIFFKKIFIYFHFPCLLWGLYIQFSSKICPLTYLENWLLKKGGKSFYDEGFVSNYIFNIVYPKELDSEVQFILGIILLIFNLLLYSFYFAKKLKN